MNKINETKKMTAAIITKYGNPEVIKIQEISIPQPKDDEVLLRNFATSINTADVLHRGGKAPKAAFWGIKRIIGFFLRLFLFRGLRKPRQRIPGSGFSGEIVAIGKDVINWKIGDHVFGFSELGGSCAEYMVVSESVLVKKPSNLNFQEAAAVPGGSSPALVSFRDLATPERGDKVLIIGASGGIGTFAVQMAKNVYGAEVSGVCGPTNVDMVKQIGADFIIDYTLEDYTKSDSKYDIIFDAVAASTLSKCKNILTSEGVYVSNNPINSPRNFIPLITNSKKFKTGTADESAEALNTLREWIEDGKVKPVIDKVYPLSQTADAHRHYETGHAKGRIVISID